MAYNIKKNKGFTLLEVLVTLAIFVIMTTLLLANQRRFSNNLDLTNLAYDISLSIRQAQTYGYAVKAQGSTGTNNFQTYYGVHFDLNSPTSFAIFADTKGNNNDNDNTNDNSDEGKFCAPSGTSCVGSDIPVTTYNLKNNFSIVAICNEDSTESCYPSSNTIDIVFKRPNPDAYIGIFTASENTPIARPNHIRIKIKSKDDKYKGIDVYKSGQVSVVDIAN